MGVILVSVARCVLCLIVVAGCLRLFVSFLWFGWIDCCGLVWLIDLPFRYFCWLLWGCCLHVVFCGFIYFLVGFDLFGCWFGCCVCAGCSWRCV